MDFSLDRLPVDIVLFALVAGFLVLRLRSVLGRRVGLQAAPQPQPRPVERPGPVIEGRPVPPTAGAKIDIPTPETRVGQILTQIRQRETTFDAADFLRGVETAFRQIILAYAAGDRATLKDCLTADAYAAFDGAITTREGTGEKQHTELRAIDSLAILDAQLQPDGRAAVEVKVVSDQVNYVTDKDGAVLSGADAVTEFSDLWVFERLLGANMSGAAWRLSSARSA
ncbi:mitochondrial import inner membrane translocase subunit Tim44 [Ameyamaea chiangmaiensis NBRC 103196]|uniref:Tim44 domain-containing protein n=2 Tax=Ameyamaea chiangmaiensis TaxID=442969 RepID=A0A850PHQ6_9PROT|nr:Tim44/TimA family putative adaptor protein [Ameyamaea chiangmaiensis]MBS4073860.1 Tim44 domain-containing protein [Ameyamaea chiangmaiensis]NVN41940.1 Tim44 domain-containing protein [Ameyamaea chiangmaiensis]GBQ68154.1 mitochondrial import inner membrane translocase subunit Tim44 [Ameyamaea chiangmaiensis NBRC 103196]